VSDLDRFTLAEVSVNDTAATETFADLYRDIIDLLETKYEHSAWQVASNEDIADDPEYRDAYRDLRTEAENAARGQSG